MQPIETIDHEPGAPLTDSHPIHPETIAHLDVRTTLGTRQNDPAT
jgi:hypothetical protein